MSDTRNHAKGTAGLAMQLVWHGTAEEYSDFLLAMCIAAGVLAPAAAFAHVKWFTDPAAHPLRVDVILSDRTLLWINSSAVAVLVLAGIRRLVGRRVGSDSPLLRRMARGAPT